MKLYLKIFWKRFLKNKTHFLLNLLGLILGISCFIFALIFVFYEKGFDSFQKNKDRTARVVTKVVSNGNEVRMAFANGFLVSQMPKAFPEISHMVRFLKFDGQAAVKRSNDNVALRDLYYTESDIFSVFSYRLTEGDPASCLSDPNSIVLTRKVAESIFGEASPINQLVLLNGKPLKVTGVMADIPGNTDLKFEALISLSTIPERATDWMYVYILFNTPADLKNFQPKLDTYAKNVVNPQLGGGASLAITYTLQPLRKVHFSQGLQYDTPKGNFVYVNIFLLTGILVLLIAAVNSINMTIVRSFSQAMEVAVHRIYGASRRQLIIRQGFESLSVGVIAVLFSFVIIWLFLPPFSLAINRSLTFSDLINWKILGALIVALAVMGGGGAIYSGFYLNRIQLADTVKSRNSNIRPLRVVPRIMLGFQFFISIGMFVAAIEVYRQVKFFKDTPLGFNSDNVLIVELPQGGSSVSGEDYLKNMLRDDANIIKTSFCAATALPGADPDVDVMEYKENSIKVQKTVNHIDVDADFFSLLHIPIVNGVNFPNVQDSTARSNAIVSSLFAAQAGWKNPIGQEISIVGGSRKAKVIGVVPDFHFKSLHNAMVPIVIFQQPDEPAYLLARIRLSKTQTALKDIQSAWKHAFPDLPFYYSFLDQHLLQQYQDDIHLLDLLLSLTLLIVIISCVGLVAYVSFIIRMARLEIAVRRVVGASFGDIFAYFLRKFVFLLFFSFLAVCPLIWYLVHNWLGQFSYHISQKPIDFLIALTAMAVMLVLVILNYTVQSIKVIPARIMREK